MTDSCLVRYSASGILDPTFGTGGKVRTHFFDQDIPRAIALQTDGKIIVVGEGSEFDPNPPDFSTLRISLIAARYDVSGALDTTFGDEGIRVSTAMAE